MPPSKATKKFEKNHLKDVIKRRKEGAKIKQKLHMKEKKKQRKVEDNAPADKLPGEKETVGSKPRPDKSNAFGEMSMDQFFEGGLRVPEIPKAKKGATKTKTGKRKRTEVAKQQESDSEAASGSDGESSGDDAKTHKEQLAALADKDPEFYKYLKENDSELLDFNEDIDLAGLDLSEDDDEAETPRKKRKGDDDDELSPTSKNEVTKEMVEKWRVSMSEKSSLRAMKEVVLAFRAAAHLNEDDDKAYKYSISDSDGKQAQKR